MNFFKYNNNNYKNYNNNDNDNDDDNDNYNNNNVLKNLWMMMQKFIYLYLSIRRIINQIRLRRETSRYI